MSIDGDRWFYIEQDRKRERETRRRRAKKRLAHSVHREHSEQSRHVSPSIRMELTDWEYDEFGNMSRKIYSR